MILSPCKKGCPNNGSDVTPGKEMELMVTTITRKILPHTGSGYVILYMTKLGRKTIKMLSAPKYQFEDRVGRSVTNEEFLTLMDKLDLDSVRRMSGHLCRSKLHEQYHKLVREWKEREASTCKVIGRINP
jgi:hypothetical protein